MSITRVVGAIFAAGVMVLSVVAYAQDPSTGSGQVFPNRPIRIVTTTVGGGNDFTARQISQGISGSLGQPVIVENRPTVVIVAEIVSKAPPDGYTMLIAGIFWITPLLQNVRYDPVRDFSPITATDKSPNILAVHTSVPVTSVQELIALAKAKPGQLHYGAGPVGDSVYLTTELFNSMAGIKVVHIAYKGGGTTLNGLLSGEVQMAFVPPPSSMPLIKSGKLRALAVTSAEPSALVPGLPTIAASVPGYEAISITSMFAPAKTPAANIKRLNQEIARFLKTPEVKERFFNAGVETVGNSPQELAAVMNSNLTKMGKVIKDAGIKVN